MESCITCSYFKTSKRLTSYSAKSFKFSKFQINPCEQYSSFFFFFFFFFYDNRKTLVEVYKKRLLFSLALYPQFPFAMATINVYGKTLIYNFHDYATIRITFCFYVKGTNENSISVA